MLTIEVKRHGQGKPYFEPWIEEHQDGNGRGCTFHFHWDDITEEGVGIFAELLNHQVRVKGWRPRPAGTPRGRRIPVFMVRCDVMSERDVVAVYDQPDWIAYIMRADLITGRGAAGITRAQTERTPYWERRSAYCQTA
jgi:hypothetical protein